MAIRMEMDAMDPRIYRTHRRVLACTRILMESGGSRAVTFSAVASLAKVSRQTLYRIWGDRESLLLDATRWIEQEANQQQATEEPPLKTIAILPSIRDVAADNSYRIALARLVLRAAIDPADSQELTETVRLQFGALRRTFGPISEDEFLLAVGPIIMSALLLRRNASDELLQTLTLEAVTRRALAPRDSTEPDIRLPNQPIWDQTDPGSSVQL